MEKVCMRLKLNGTLPLPKAVVPFVKPCGVLLRSFSKADTGGFTLVETLIVILIVCIVAALAVPNLRPMVETLRLRTAADMIKRQLIIARTRAISDPYKHCAVLFDFNGQRSFIFFNNNVSYAVDAADTVNKYGGEYMMPKGITLGLPGANPVVNNIVVFRGDGSAKNGGSVQVTNNLNKKRTIHVLPSTGRIKVQ
jgi:prepilin-type N-terminal cleavage/methylation domain-containing protein